MRIHSLFVSAVAGMLLSAGMPIHAPAQSSDQAGAVRIGSLECFVDAGTGFVLGSTKDVSCVLYGTDDAALENYIGELSKYGIDIGFTREARMVWDVYVSEGRSYEPGSLSGTYAGASASASLSFGLGASILIGGLTESFALQPIRIGKQKGLNIAFGIARMSLTEVGPAPVEGEAGEPIEQIEQEPAQ